jgi:hypothetical protein
MEEIRFAKSYQKMPRFISETTLLAVVEVTEKMVSSQFLDYDTEYFEYVQTPHGEVLVKGFHELPEYPFLVLILLSETNLGPEIWTTIRRKTYENVQKYERALGERVEIIIENQI